MILHKSGYHGIFLPEAGVVLDGTNPPAGTAPPAETISPAGTIPPAGTTTPAGPASYDIPPTIFISHAHADHVPRSRKAEVCATPATAALMRARGHAGSIREIPFGEPVDLPKARVTLYPAGHILGSAMIFVESDAGSLLYTGDCRTPPSPVTEGFELPDRLVDYLVIEATFGLPIYKWAPSDELFSRIRRFARLAIENGDVPVFLCYNLGKAQEVMHALAGEKVQIHEAGVGLCEVYEQFGVKLGSWEPFNVDTCAGKVLIMPAPAMKSEVMQQIPNLRIAFVSGWASLESRLAQTGADAGIPLSDHLDFFELIRLCREMKPGKVLLTHSPNPEVALHFLEEEGIPASSLETEISHFEKGNG